MEHRPVAEDKTLVSLFQMVVLDVLIIGGGPHALTLASLLSRAQPDANWNPGHDTCSSLQSTLEPSGDHGTSQEEKKQKQSPAAGKAGMKVTLNSEREK